MLHLYTQSYQHEQIRNTFLIKNLTSFIHSDILVDFFLAVYCNLNWVRGDIFKQLFFFKILINEYSIDSNILMNSEILSNSGGNCSFEQTIVL